MNAKFRMQVAALMRKDLIIIRAHKRAMLVELVFPLLMATLSCLLLTTFLKLFGDDAQEIYQGEATCNTWWSGLTPHNITYNVTAGLYPDDAGSSRQSSCVRSQYVGVLPTTYANWTDLYAAFESYFATLQPDQQSSAGIIAYDMNYTIDRLIVYQRFLGYGSGPAVGALAYSMFHNSTTDMTAYFNSNPISFNLRTMLSISAALMMNFAFLPMASTMAGRLVDEKNARVREHLRVMGVSPLAYLVAAFGTSAIRVCFVSSAMLILMLSLGATTVGAAFAIFLSLVCFGFTLASFAQIMPAFFSKSTYSNAAISMFLSVCSAGAPFASMLPAAGFIPITLVFSPVSSIVINAQLLAGGGMFELPISVGLAFFFLIVQVFFYSALSQYLYAINPGDYGVPKPPLFPLHAVAAAARRICVGNGRRQSNSPHDACDAAAGSTPIRTRIAIEGMFKYYGSQRDTAAVNDLSLSINEREIFALLGHNGAGKTTLISILTGMIPASHYRTAWVAGLDLNTQMDEIRQQMGTCPQFDVLFDDLSAAEHVELYAALKGKPAGEHRGQELLQRLKLPLDDQRASTFSGGMKRRLSVANALVGDSPILYLDEMSSGCDPISRRQMWEILREERNAGKTIILTTHYLEEADFLGDRIAIMSHGRRFCCDTSANLKRQYGVGYYLKLVKATAGTPASRVCVDEAPKGEKPHANEHSSDLSGGDERERATNSGVSSGINKALMDDIFRSHNVVAALHHESVGDSTYLLPHDAIDRFGDLLEELERRLPALGATSYGLAQNSLEDVFVAIAEKEAARVAAEKEAATSGSPGDRSASKKEPRAIEQDIDDPIIRLPSGKNVDDMFSAATLDVSASRRFISQVATIIHKKWLFMRRSRRLLVMGIIVPVLLIAIGFASLIPNWNQDNSRPWGYWLSDNLPDMDHLHVPVLVSPQLTPKDVPTLDLKAVMEKWTEYYREMRRHQGFDSRLTYEFVSERDFQLGTFLKVHSISWIANLKPVLQMMAGDFLLLEESRARFGGPSATFTWLFNDYDWSDSFLQMVDPTFRAAIDAVAAGVDGPVPDVLSLPMPLNETDAPTPAPTSDAPRTPSPGNNDGDSSPAEKFFTLPLAILVVLAIGQYCGNAALFIADDLNRQVYTTMRIHGCSAAAYWVGNVIADASSSLVFVGAYIIGTYGRGLEQIQNMQLVFHCFMITIVLINSILFAYAIVCLLPLNLKPNTIIGLINMVAVMLLVIPLVCYLAVTDAPRILLYLTPPRSLYYAVATYIKPSEVWSTEASVGAMVSTLLWNVPPLAVLWCYSYLTWADVTRQGQHAPQHQQPPVRGAVVNIGVPMTQEPTTEETTLLDGSPSLPVGGLVVDDPDVADEAARVRRSPGEYMAAAVGLRKVYTSVATDVAADAGACARMCAPKHDKVAVPSLTLGLRSGECFGLLGPNGCGKTTTIKMLLRELQQTAGSVLFPYDLDFERRTRDDGYRFARMGVCQQGDSLFDLLTAEEHMRIYLRLRLAGCYDAMDWEEYIATALERVYLLDTGDKPVSAYSGGMKRKLAACIAMFTGARVVCLDEPGTGQDAFARRAMWRSIQDALQRERCVLLTTHALEESEAVCARIGIMVDGRLQCIGNAQHLKNRFGSGYTIIISLIPNDTSSPVRDGIGFEAVVAAGVSDEAEPERVQEVERGMKKTFGGTCELKEVLGHQLRFSVREIGSLAFAFRALQCNKQEWRVASYSVSQMSSLEQIFINFAGSSGLEGN